MTCPRPHRRVAVTTLLGAAATVWAAPRLQAADPWPTRPVRIIVPFAPGGGADSSARVLAELLSPELGQAVVVDNRPGAGSAIGVGLAAQSRDGHTLLMGSNSMLINPALNPKIGYDPVRDFDAIAMVSAQPLVLVVPSTSDLTSLAALVAAAKAEPGRLMAGNSGNGTLAHIAAELFGGQAGVRITPVPYKGESALLPEMLGGLVSFGFLNLPSVAPHLRGGRLRALAVSSPAPVAELPGVPTLRSLGFPSLELQGWAALVAARGTLEPEALDRLSTLVAQALASETVRSRFAAIGVAPNPMTRQATATFLAAETERYAEVIRSRGIRAE